MKNSIAIVGIGISVAIGGIIVNDILNGNREQLIKDQLIKDQLIKEQRIKDKLIKEQRIKDKLIKDQLIKDQLIKDQLIKDKLIKDKLIKEQRIKKQKYAEEIDLYIRKMKDFDSREPLKYKYLINSIDLCQFSTFYTESSFIRFIKNQKRFIINSNNTISLKYMTPFQGIDSHRKFGYFKCGNHKCNNQWTSAFSWKNKWQQCQKCNSMIYPYKQRSLKKCSLKKDKPPHDNTRCEKCIELGTYCC